MRAPTANSFAVLRIQRFARARFARRQRTIRGEEDTGSPSQPPRRQAGDRPARTGGTARLVANLPPELDTANVRAEVVKLWRLLQSTKQSYTPADAGAESISHVGYRSYRALHLRISKALLHRFFHHEAETLAAADWKIDVEDHCPSGSTTNADSMNYTSFSSSIAELASVWCAEPTPDQVCTFAWIP